jgi:hypothetical protein
MALTTRHLSNLHQSVLEWGRGRMLPKVLVNSSLPVGWTLVTLSVAFILMIYKDNNFDSIRAAIREGRRIFDNIQRFILHLLATNVAEVILLVCGLGFQDDSKLGLSIQYNESSSNHALQAEKASTPCRPLPFFGSI